MSQADFVVTAVVVSQLCFDIKKRAVSENFIPDRRNITLIIEGLNFFFTLIVFVGETATFFKLIHIDLFFTHLSTAKKVFPHNYYFITIFIEKRLMKMRRNPYFAESSTVSMAMKAS